MRKVLIPGDPEREMEIERMKNGIPLLEPGYCRSGKARKKFEIPFN